MGTTWYWIVSGLEAFLFESQKPYPKGDFINGCGRQMKFQSFLLRE